MFTPFSKNKDHRRVVRTLALTLVFLVFKKTYHIRTRTNTSALISFTLIITYNLSQFTIALPLGPHARV